MSHERDQKQLDQDSRDLAKLGYAQELLRDMGGFANFAVSFSIISILTGIPTFYGYGLQHGGPLQMSLGWLLVSFFTLIVSLSMAELASAYPTAGALYHWSSFLGGRAWGWFTACFNTVGQFALLAGIDYGLALFLKGFLGWDDAPVRMFSLYAVLIFSHAVFNHIGIRVVAWLNDFSAWYHMAVVAALFAVIFAKGFVQPASFMLHFHNADLTHSSKYAFLVGLLLAQWTLSGYDASAHISEETINPRKRAPWGIFMSVVVSIFFGLLMLVAVTLSIKDLPQAVAFGDNAFVEILRLRLGPQLGNALVILISGAMWLCGLATMTSASRMIYAFSRDRGLPLSTWWAKIDSKFKTPAKAIWGLSFFALLLGLSVKVYFAVTSIAVIALYLSYGMPMLARLWARSKGYDKVVGPWNLGKYSSFNTVIALLWIIFVSVVFVLPPNDEAGKYMLASIAVLLALWFGGVRKKFHGPKVHFH